MKTKLLLSLLCASAINFLPAQTLTVNDPSAEPVLIETVGISTEVTGRIAVTTFDLVFTNPNNRILEGTFEFPLLDGQHIVRFALDINGALREAVPVEKEKGRVVFEEIQRRRVDPGLIEKTAGNNYRARIFPIPAKGSRRIVIAYQENLANNNGSPHYRLALDFPNPIKKFSLDATVFTDGSSPAKATTTLPLAPLSWRENNRLEIHRENFLAKGVLEIELPIALGTFTPGQQPIPRVLTESFNNREYFYAEAILNLPDLAPKPRPAPKTIGILWDASASGRNRDHDREFAFLEKYFAQNPNLTIHLIAFRDKTATPQTFKISNNNWQQLRAALEQIIYDGATSLDGLTDNPSIDEWLLFSDGLFNYGTTLNAEKLPLAKPIHTIAASAKAAPDTLRKIASQNNGAFLDLMALPPETALKRIGTFPLRVISVDRNPESLAQVFPEPGTILGTDRTLIITGILRKPSATLRLKIGYDETTILTTLEIPLRSNSNPSHLAARAWALSKIAQLSENPDANREDIRRTSQEFRIVTDDTSLIVLETLADYIRYNITPPEELLPQWQQHRRLTDDRSNKTRTTHLDQIARLFTARVKWWETKFPKDTPSLPKEKSKNDESFSDDRSIPWTRSESWGTSPPTTKTRANIPTGGSRHQPRRLAALDTTIVAGNAVANDEVLALESFVVAGAREGNAATIMRQEAPSAGTFERAIRDVGTAHRVKEEQMPRTQASAPRPTQPSISLQPWSASASYLDHLRRVAPAERFSIYLEERADHATQPGFYLDVANFFFDEAKDADTALQILSNLAELGLEDAPLLRVLAHRLVQAGRPDLALPIFERVLKIRGEEPQSRRDLALVCAQLGQHQRAIDLLWEVVERTWDARFPEIQLIALNELNAIAATAPQPLDLSKVDPRLRQNLPVGLRIILTWDADNCDIDLWVDDPNAERCMYNRNLTYQGGRMSRDFTAGYGPEEFLLRDPKPGTYTARINYYGDSRQTALGPVTAQVRLITHFGTPQQTEKQLTVRLTGKKDSLEIGTITID